MSMEQEFIAVEPDGPRGTSYSSGDPVPAAKIPTIPRLASKILEIVESGKGALDMRSYHGGYGCSEDDFCGSTHCIAGWTTHLAGEVGRAMEDEYDIGPAAALIWTKAYGDYPSFDDNVSKEEALDSLRRFAAQDPEPSP